MTMAIQLAHRFAELGVRWFEEPVSSDNLIGLCQLRTRAPLGMDIAAGEYGAPSVEAMEECDTLVMIGTSYPYMDFLPKPGQAKCVQIELDLTIIGLRHQVEVGLIGDSKSILTALLPLLKKKNNKFLQKLQERMKDWFALME